MNKLKFLSGGLAILLLLTIFNGCQENQSPVAPDNQTIQTLNKWSLPAGATLTSATFHIHLGTANNQTVNIHRITSDWDEMTVTWANFGSAYDGIIRGSFAVGTTNEVWLTADVTSLVQDWLDGTYPNYGLLLDQVAMNFPRADYYSREHVANYIPYLTIVYNTGSGSVSIDLPAIADTYNYETFPNENYGSSNTLYTGWEFPNDKEKQSLLKFDIGTANISCETAYAKGLNAICFLDIPNKQGNNWGWTNKITESGSWNFPIYAGAGQCDESKGTLVGTLDISYDGTTVNVFYNIDSEYSLDETHLWVGTDLLPKNKKGKYISSPGQFPYNGQNPVSVNITTPFYIAAHSVVCGDYSD